MIQVKELTKYYGERPAVSNLTFELRSGEVVGLLGLNGSGKTTTIRMLSCFLIPSHGEAFIDGINIFHHPLDVKKKIGYLPETPPLYEDLTIDEYLTFVARIKGIKPEIIKNEIASVIEKTNLTEVQSAIIGHLSLGFRKRVGIAQALLGNPSVIIMDEPVSGLDPKQIVEMRNLIKNLSGKHTVLISSHILSEIFKTCDRFLFIHEGKLIHEYSFQEMETEMDRLSLLEITLSGNSKEAAEAFILRYAPNGSVVYTGEESGGHTFTIKTNDEGSFKDSIIAGIGSSGMHIQSIKKQEITLEQIFMSRV
ncbi:MAG: ABC transporter ATP-binding protein [Leptospira sp.]|nr:ABC transporter ATP-binding protein [Leptospira sp.]